MAKKSKAEEVLHLYECGMAIDDIADYLVTYTWFVKLVIEKNKEITG